ncbi:MAG: hypothetical protein EA391_06510 [Balneolaceae bacterium]|nr:MAG: hypothetical protein EA391_06510 [Balneolaceae bacterium]
MEIATIVDLLVLVGMVARLMDGQDVITFPEVHRLIIVQYMVRAIALVQILVWKAKSNILKEGENSSPIF